MDETQTQEDSCSAPRPQVSIEGYAIVRELHRGGQGIVYGAVQKATKRKVAIKVLLEGPYASKSAKRRFEREIELVAQLRHPNIIAIFHSGETEDGHQYCVMDYVRGVPLDQYAREKKLTLEDALILFSTVCDAVNYAHQKGVIHRDLKPSNILVDVDGTPKVLDFGLAKLLAGPLDTVMSLTGQVVGTLPYMSPEQARGNPDEIDIRTDVYALGVILYQMLTGHYPYPVAGQMADVLKHIAETEPTPPSRSWKSDSGVTRRLAKRVRPGECPIDDEVQTIVLRMLSKERDRRYQSAGELRRDIDHYLADEPIEAKRDSGWYVLKKQLKRYKKPTAVGAILVLLILGWGVTMSILSEKNRRLAESESHARQAAEAARAGEHEQRRRAETERDRAGEAEEEAERERDLARGQEREARYQAYIANISAAAAALAQNEIATARRRLEAAPEEFRKWEWGYLIGESEQSIAVLHGHERGVTAVAFSPDGNVLASGSGDRTVRFWDVCTGDELAVLRGHNGTVTSVAFSPDTVRAASASEDKTVRLWNVASHEQLSVLRQHESAILSVAFSPDGTRLASGAAASGFFDRGTVRIWDATTGKELAFWRKHKVGVTSVAFSPDGDRLASSGWDGIVRIRDIASGKLLSRWQQQVSVHSVCFSPDGNRLALGLGLREEPNRSAVRVWDVAGDDELIAMKGTGRFFVHSVAFSPEGNQLAGNTGHAVRIWDASTGGEIAAFSGHEGMVMSVAFSPDGARLASASRDGTVRIWDALTSRRREFLFRPDEPVLSVALSPDGTRAATVGSAVRLWDTSTGEELLVLSNDTRYVLWATSLAFSANGEYLAVGYGGAWVVTDLSTYGPGLIRLFDASSGQQIGAMAAHASPVTALEFSPDSTRLASSSRDNTLRLWDVPTGKRIATLTGHSDEVTSVAFSPDGRRLASASDDKTVRLWDVSAGQEIATLQEHEAFVKSVAFSQDGARLASASENGTVLIWDASSGEPLVTIAGDEFIVFSVVFSPDGSRVVSGSGDGTVRVWDSVSGDQLIALRGHTDIVMSVVFSPDGTRLVSASLDGTVRTWDSQPYRIRYQERQATLAAIPEADRVVDALWHDLKNWKAVAQRLREDTSLGKPLRRATLNEVLRRAADQRSD